jgi:IclR family transcriptional regulator, acetate operon repressor
VAVSAPFFDGTERVASSLSVFGPSARLEVSQVARFGKLLREAQELSQVLGKSQLMTHEGTSASSTRPA